MKLTIDQVNDLLAHGYHTFHAISEESGLKGLLMAEDSGLMEENVTVLERADAYGDWQMQGVRHERRRNPQGLRLVPSILMNEVRP